MNALVYHGPGKRAGRANPKTLRCRWCHIAAPGRNGVTGR
jgi:hypothetical protein